jgi:hypothetical protein
VTLDADVSDIGYDDIAPLLAAHGDGKRQDWFTWRKRLQRLVRCPEPEDAGLSGLGDSERRRVKNWFVAGCPRWPQSRYAAYFFDLDAWSEYWDIYHPETRGCYHFGDGSSGGYLSTFLPSPAQPRVPVFDAWKAYALASRERSRAFHERRRFEQAVIEGPGVAEAVIAVDQLVRDLTNRHFRVHRFLDVDAYLDAMERFARDTLPDCPERYQRLAEDDPRKPHALRHMMAGDIMWFAWAVHLEAVDIVASPTPEQRSLRSLLMAGVAFGCAMDYSFTGRCRTRKEYEAADSRAWRLIWSSGRDFVGDFKRAAAEVRELFFIRTYGDG